MQWEAHQAGPLGLRLHQSSQPPCGSEINERSLRMGNQAHGGEEAGSVPRLGRRAQTALDVFTLGAAFGLGSSGLRLQFKSLAGIISRSRL